MEQYFKPKRDGGNKKTYSLRLDENVIDMIKVIETKYDIRDSITCLLVSMYNSIDKGMELPTSTTLKQNVDEINTIKRQNVDSIQNVDENVEFSKQNVDKPKRVVPDRDEPPYVPVIASKETPKPKINDNPFRDNPKYIKNVKLYVTWIKSLLKQSEDGNNYYTMVKHPDSNGIKKWLLARKSDKAVQEIWMYDEIVYDTPNGVWPIYLTDSDFEEDKRLLTEWIKSE